MATDVVYVDALPYFDQGYDEPGVREAVRLLAGIYYPFTRLLPKSDFTESVWYPGVVYSLSGNCVF